MIRNGEDRPVTVWTIYHEPNDYPGRWVVRGHEVFPGRGLQPHSFCFVTRTLSEARAKVPAGTRRFRRAPKDDRSFMSAGWPRLHCDSRRAGR